MAILSLYSFLILLSSTFHKECRHTIHTRRTCEMINHILTLLIVCLMLFIIPVNVDMEALFKVRMMFYNIWFVAFPYQLNVIDR